MMKISTQNPCASSMGKVILNALGDRKVRFVFPTQTSADSWAEALLRYGAVDAIEADRFLSLDMLIAAARERALPLDKTPADQALRLLWATGVLSGIAKSKCRQPSTGRRLSFLAGTHGTRQTRLSRYKIADQFFGACRPLFKGICTQSPLSARARSYRSNF